MTSWTQALRFGTLAGSVASVVSAVYLARVGHRRNGEPAAPLNAVSHWFFGDAALREDGPSMRHTLTGYLVHHGASVFWGTLHAKFWGRRAAAAPMPALAAAVATSAAACFVDYRMTPRRLTPGFERRVSTRELALVYGWFAVGLAAGSLLAARRAQRHRAVGTEGD